MGNQITVTLNGKELVTDSDKTILELARENGYFIPTFCEDKRLEHVTSCFVCVVEVKNARTLVPSCATKLADKMVIHTESDKVLKARKAAIDLMLSDHKGDCIAPCSTTCPAGTDVQGYVAHVANGEFKAAAKLIKKRLAMPLACGTICPAPCESQCRRALVEEPIAIRAIKRVAAIHDLNKAPYLPKVAADTGKRVSIVGAGPAGLACAYYLRQYGHNVEIYEALSMPGGMLRFGIPRFRLPWDQLDKEIKSITDLNIKIHLNKKLGSDFSIQDLKDKGADAILIAIGAHASKESRIQNESAPGVIGAVEFLRNVILGKDIGPHKKVAVIGGGDVAMDCARVARRLGSEVSLIYRRTIEEMPALEHERVEAQEEGVEFLYLTAPVAAVLGEDKKVKALRISKMKLGDPDSSGRRAPIKIENSESELEFDLIISAIGQTIDLSAFDKDSNKLRPNTTKYNTISYDTKTHTTSLDGVFAAGDCAFGPDTAVHALAEGKQAAEAIHLYLQNKPLEFRDEYKISKGRLEELSKDDFAPRFERRARAKEKIASVKLRLSKDHMYDPMSKELDDTQARKEASRCLECGCNARFDCKLKTYATITNASEKTYAGEVNTYKEDTRHPLIKFELEKCIKCGSCARFCKELRNINALTLVGRGFVSHPAPIFEDPLQNTKCDSCGGCVDICPTGALSYNFDKSKGPWPWDITDSACLACGNACKIKVYSVDSKVIKVEGNPDDIHQKGILCKDGRFAHYLLRDQSEESIEKKQEKTYDKLMIEAEKILYKAKNLGIFISPSLTLEEQMSAYHFAKKQNAKLFYIKEDDTIEKTPKEVFPYSKKQGIYNVALLKHLGASAYNGEKLDVGLFLCTCLPAFKGTSILLSQVKPLKAKPDIYIKVRGNFKKSGTYLNIYGELIKLEGIKSQIPDISSIMATFLGLDELDLSLPNLEGKIELIQTSPSIFDLSVERAFHDCF